MEDLKASNHVNTNLSVAQEDATVRYDFSDQEKEDLRNELAQNTIQLDDKEDEKKAFMDHHKTEVNPLKKRNRVISRQLKDGFEYRSVKVNLIPNEVKRTMEQYDENGDWVGSRPMTAEERRHYTVLDRINNK